MNKTENLTRREKLYACIIGGLMYKNTWYGEEPPMRPRNKDGVYFSSEYKVGDLIITQTSIWRNHNIFNIGICDQIISRDTCIIRDIFTGRTCNYGNESFLSVQGIGFQYLMTEKQYKLWNRFWRACGKVDKGYYYLRPCGANFGSWGMSFDTRRKWENVISRHTFPQNILFRDMVSYLEKEYKRLKNIPGEKEKIRNKVAG